MSKIQVLSPNGLEVMRFQRLGGKVRVSVTIIFFSLGPYLLTFTEVLGLNNQLQKFMTAVRYQNLTFFL